MFFDHQKNQMQISLKEFNQLAKNSTVLIQALHNNFAITGTIIQKIKVSNQQFQYSVLTSINLTNIK